MAICEFQLQGMEALQRKLRNRVESFKEQLVDELLIIAEDACTHAKLNAGYKDHTANLKNSISFVLYKDGRIISQHIGEHKPKDENARVVTADFVQTRINEYASQNGASSAKGYNLVIVAPMEYAAAVEHKGYNVLYLTNAYLQERLKEVMANLRGELTNTI